MVGFVVTRPIKPSLSSRLDPVSQQPWTLSHKYEKSLSPLGKVPHSFIGVLSSPPHGCSKLLPQLLFFQLVFSSSVFGFKLGGWLPIIHHL